MMKKFFSVLFAFSAVILSVVSCGDANDTTEGYSKGIFTIEGKRVVPELSDTFFVVDNADVMGLNDGDRALLRLDFFIDNLLGMKGAKYEIGEVYEVFTADNIVDANSVNPDEYTSAFLGLTNFYYGAVWAWNGIQNINVVYKSNGAEPEFKMLLTGYDNDTLRLSLLSKFTDGDKENAKLLCYDLKSILPILNSEQVRDILRADTLNTKITMKHLDIENETVKERTIIGGKLANPFK